MFICSQQISAQKASDVLENGITINKDLKLFFKYNITDKVLEIGAAKNDISTNTLIRKDSTIFLIHDESIKPYLKPLNPINYSFTTETKIILDPINEAASSALTSLITMLETIKDPTKLVEKTNGIRKTISSETCTEFEPIKSKIESIQKKLSDSKKTDIKNEFEHLKKLNFKTEKETSSELSESEKTIKTFLVHFKSIEDSISAVQKKVDEYPCTDPNPFSTKYIFNSILKELSSQLEQQKKRYSNLKKVYDSAKSTYVLASQAGESVEWSIPLKPIPSDKDKISIFTITINENGYSLSGDDEIVSIESKELIKKTIRIRRFQRFVPEVSIGTAFTFFKYYSYGTTSDLTGQQYVSQPTENTIKNLNIATMINFNYYIPNSAIHPFYQLGFGINSEIPTVLTGFGIRGNVNGIKRLAISGGLAMSWIKELNKLKPGDPITGTDDIDKDYKYSSAPKFTPYLALQYNF